MARIKMTDEERTSYVRQIFSRIARAYDLFNHTASLGRDVHWRRLAALKAAGTGGQGRILDIASGTGDLAMELARTHPADRVVAADFTPEMLIRAQRKIRRAGLEHQVFPILADATHLPLADGSFDAVTISFGIRNIPDKKAALAEFRRVLARGGRLVVLELAFPRAWLLKKVYQLYLDQLLPRFGRLLSKDPGAYQYLADSVMDFPDPADFETSLKEAGFCRTGHLRLTMGVCFLAWGERD